MLCRRVLELQLRHLNPLQALGLGGVLLLLLLVSLPLAFVQDLSAHHEHSGETDPRNA